MAGDTQCRRCLLREAFPRDYEKYVLGLLKRIPPAEKADGALYEGRLRTRHRFKKREEINF